ncbi:hypothetical protein [Vitiosangium sp. GDMCC 1.1324]|uniref:hypothetical protein n=1 Tax=Vitiosangium sp. (strain GDMCC 1.1324) TaxID=2138576 RepID=UPI000D367835|nr:hypothetical protein [Vitiosangium sp. GDMCC 1.1324]PTL77572.1 hypothetical protein DAT35_42980 [Vitiosangium sp. GDMCC 1.1324]
MRKLLVALVVTLGSVAMAEQPPAPSTSPSTGTEAPQAQTTYNAAGTVKSANDNSVTISRPNRKDSSLEVRQDTVVMLDGKKVEASALPEGSQVRARFQREGQTLIAVELDATSPGSGK